MVFKTKDPPYGTMSGTSTTCHEDGSYTKSKVYAENEINESGVVENNFEILKPKISIAGLDRDLPGTQKLEEACEELGFASAQQGAKVSFSGLSWVVYVQSPKLQDVNTEGEIETLFWRSRPYNDYRFCEFSREFKGTACAQFRLYDSIEGLIEMPQRPKILPQSFISGYLSMVRGRDSMEMHIVPKGALVPDTMLGKTVIHSSLENSPEDIFAYSKSFEHPTNIITLTTEGLNPLREQLIEQFEYDLSK